MSGSSSAPAVRVCSRCHQSRAASEFGKDPYRCRACLRALTADWRARRRSQQRAACVAQQCGLGAPPTPARRLTNPAEALGRIAPDRPRAGLKEYVPTHELSRRVVAHLGEDLSMREMALCVGVDKRTIQGIVRCARPWVTIDLADRICVAMNAHVDELPSVWRHPHAPTHRVPVPRVD